MSCAPILILGFVLLACSPKPVPQQSPLDTAANHYARGRLSLERGDLWTAQREFERARSLDGDFPGVYTGYALVALEQGDFWRARQEVEKALHQDNDFVDAHIALGRIASREGQSRGEAPDKWLPEALRAYKKALAKAPDNPETYYYQGLSYLQAQDLVEARASLAQIVERNRGPLVEKARAEIERIQMVERAKPGSALGLKIGLVPRISRAELAVLLLEELKLAELLEKRRPAALKKAFAPPQAKGAEAPRPTDVENSWARPWIEEVLALGVPGLELFPDHTFQPDQPLTRANYALVNQGLLILLSGDSSLATRYIGEPSRFADVRSDFYAYNAIALNAERGIMEADKLSGRFRPEDPVSGAEALLIISELQDAFRMEF
jgi:Tfp pilus assembly protein PilF